MSGAAIDRDGIADVELGHELRGPALHSATVARGWYCRVMRLPPSLGPVSGSSNAGRGKCDHIEDTARPPSEDRHRARASFPQSNGSAGTLWVGCRQIGAK